MKLIDKNAPLRFQFLTLQEVENEELNRDDNVLYIVDDDGTNCACVEFQTRNCGNVKALTRFLDLYRQAEKAKLLTVISTTNAN